MALLAIVGFVHFVHRIATKLQAYEMVQRIGARLRVALRELAESSGLERRPCGTLPWRRHVRGHHEFLIAASGKGYVQTVDYDGLVAWCQEHNCYLQILAERHDS